MSIDLNTNTSGLARSICVDETTGHNIIPEAAGGSLKTIGVAYQPSTLSYKKLLVDSSGQLLTNGTGGGTYTIQILDGSDVAEGATTDVAITTDSNGTVSGKLRGLVKILSDVWDSTNHWLKTQITSNGEVIDPLNSSTTPLGSNGVFTGAWVNTMNYSQIQVIAYSDQPSAATNGIQFQFSTDGVNVDHIHGYSVSALQGDTVQTQCHAKFYRIVYTNGAVAQGAFRMQSILRPISSQGSVVEANDAVSSNDDCLVTKALITGQNYLSPGTYVDVKTTPDGAIITNQNTTVDTGNSSTTNIASGATFTGAWTSCITFIALQFSLRADQNCIIYVDQSSDGVNADITDSYNYYYINPDGGAGQTVQTVSTFYRVRVTNVGTSTTTFFRLQTLSVPMLSPMPRSLDPDGNLRTSIKTMYDQSGFKTYFSPFGEQVSVPLYRLIGSVFSSAALDSVAWTSSTGTGGSVTEGTGNLTLATGTTANNTVSVQSVGTALFTSGQVNYGRFVFNLPDTGTANNTRRWGCFDVNSGAFFQLSGTTFSLVTRKSGVDAAVSSGSFNGNYGTTYALDTNVHTWEIKYTPLKVYFFIDGFLYHTVTANSSPWYSTIHLPIRFENNNSGGSTTNVSFNIRLGFIAKLGIPQTQSSSYFQQGTTAGVVIKNSPGNLHGITLSSIANNAAITLYDNTAASGTIIWSSGSIPANSTPFDLQMNGITFSTGLTLVIATAAANALVKYE